MTDPSPPPLRHRVKAAGDGLTLGRYLRGLLPATDDEALAVAIREGRFSRADGEVLGPEYRLSQGELVLARIEVKNLDESILPPPPERLEVVYEDDQLLVVNKAAGLLSYPQGTHVQGALAIAERQLAEEGRPSRLRPLHRLDRETTGVLMMAKTATADRRIKLSFKQRKVAKSYLCIARGRLPGGMQRCCAPIGPDEGAIRIKMRVRGDGQSAETLFRTIGWFGDHDFGEAGHGYTWVEARPQTGRTHQIRVHLAHLGHPIVGDKVYCDGGRAFLLRWEGRLTASDIEALGLPRQALHAWTTVIQHPTTGEMLRLEAAPPRDLPDFAAQRGGEGPGQARFQELR